jgi:hypothetical protein
MQTGLPCLRLRRREEATLDVLPLHDAYELPLRRGHDDALGAVLSHVLPYLPELTIGTDGRRTWRHRQFHSGFRRSVQGCPL